MRKHMQSANAFQFMNSQLNTISKQNQYQKSSSFQIKSENQDQLPLQIQTSRGPLRKRERTKIEWSLQQDTLLLSKYAQIGPKWTLISELLPQKSTTWVKNRFYSCIRRLAKKMVIVQKDKKIGNRHPISEVCLLTMIEVGRNKSSFSDERFKNININQQQVIDVRNLILNQAVCPEEEQKLENIEHLVQRIMEVRPCLKFINAKRARKKLKEDESESAICCEETQKKETYCPPYLNIESVVLNGDGQNEMSKVYESRVYQQQKLQIQYQGLQRPKVETPLSKQRLQKSEIDEKEMEGSPPLERVWSDVFEQGTERINPLIFF